MVELPAFGSEGERGHAWPAAAGWCEGKVRTVTYAACTSPRATEAGHVPLTSVESRQTRSYVLRRVVYSHF